MKKKMQKIFMVLSSICICAAVTGCAILPKEEEDRAVALIATEEEKNYTMEMVQRQDLILSAIVYATYTQRNGQELSFGTSGRLSEVYVKEGDIVSAGDVVAVLEGYAAAAEEVRLYEENIEQMETEFEQLFQKREFALRELEIYYRYAQIDGEEYLKRLLLLGDTYDGRLAELEDALYIDKLRMERAKETMEASALHSDISGIVTYAKKLDSSQNWWGGHTGVSVQKGEKIVSVMDTEECSFVASTEYADSFQVGDTVTLSTNSGASYNTFVSDISDDKVYFQLETPNMELSVGTMANYTLVLEEKKNVLTISKNALHKAEDFYYVYFINEDGVRQMKEVSVGMFGNSRVEITAGLEAADVVITR